MINMYVLDMMKWYVLWWNGSHNPESWKSCNYHSCASFFYYQTSQRLYMVIRVVELPREQCLAKLIAHKYSFEFHLLDHWFEENTLENASVERLKIRVERMSGEEFSTMICCQEVMENKDFKIGHWVY